MKVKKRKEDKSVKKLVVEKPKRDESGMTQDDTDQKMDFGGMPDRDLKKNLGGCG